MATNVANLSNKDLLDMWFDLCGDKTDISEKDSIMFSLDQNDVIYVEKKDGKWVDVTPEGITGVTTIVNIEGKLKIQNNDVTFN